ELKTIVGDRLRPPSRSTAKQHAYRNRRHVYLICDENDQRSEATREHLAGLQAHLFAQGYEVALPAFEGEEAEIREDNRQTRLGCDAVVVFFGTATEVWLRAKLRDVSKAPGWGRTKPMACRAIYASPPRSEAKERLHTNESLVIRANDRFDPATVAPLVAA